METNATSENLETGGMANRHRHEESDDESLGSETSWSGEEHTHCPPPFWRGDMRQHDARAPDTETDRLKEGDAREALISIATHPRNFRERVAATAIREWKNVVKQIAKSTTDKNVLNLIPDECKPANNNMHNLAVRFEVPDTTDIVEAHVANYRANNTILPEGHIDDTGSDFLQYLEQDVGGADEYTHAIRSSTPSDAFVLVANQRKTMHVRLRLAHQGATIKLNEAKNRGYIDAVLAFKLRIYYADRHPYVPVQARHYKNLMMNEPIFGGDTLDEPLCMSDGGACTWHIRPKFTSWQWAPKTRRPFVLKATCTTRGYETLVAETPKFYIAARAKQSNKRPRPDDAAAP